MASEKQIVANKANALKSRGPRSAGGKARSSRNAIRHGLSANIWKQASAVSSIEHLTRLFRAVAEYQTRSIRTVRSRIGKLLCEAADSCDLEGSLAENLVRLQSIDRYEKRITSRKRKVFRQMQREI
jgi:hypothetical protein